MEPNLIPFNPSFKHARPVTSEGASPLRPNASRPPRPDRRPGCAGTAPPQQPCAVAPLHYPLGWRRSRRRILQETSIQIFRKLRFLREPAVFHAWTLRIASRIAITHLKRAHRWQPLDDSLPGTVTPDPNLGGPPDAAFLSLLDHVPPASRAVLLLHYQHDLSLEETAAILDIPVGTAKSRLHYGVATLRKHLTFERNPA